MSRWLLLLLIGVLISISVPANADEEPAILQANVYRNQVDVTQYLVSEKLELDCDVFRYLAMAICQPQGVLSQQNEAETIFE